MSDDERERSSSNRSAYIDERLPKITLAGAHTDHRTLRVLVSLTPAVKYANKAGFWQYQVRGLHWDSGLSL